MFWSHVNDHTCQTKGKKYCLTWLKISATKHIFWLLLSFSFLLFWGLTSHKLSYHGVHVDCCKSGWADDTFSPVFSQQSCAWATLSEMQWCVGTPLFWIQYALARSPFMYSYCVEFGSYFIWLGLGFFLIGRIIIPHKTSGTNQYCWLFWFGDTFIINISIRNVVLVFLFFLWDADNVFFCFSSKMVTHTGDSSIFWRDPSMSLLCSSLQYFMLFLVWNCL